MAWTRLELRDRTAPPQAASTTPVGLWAILALVTALAAFWLSLQESHAAAATPDSTFRAEEHLKTAQVAIRKPGAAEQPCTWNAADGRWACGAQDFAFVGPYAGLAAGKAMRCMWLHPHTGGTVTVVRWPDLHLGDHLEARLRLLDDVQSGTPTRLQVFAAGQSLGSLTVSDGRDRADLDIDIPLGRGVGELRLEISTANNDWRLACAEVLMTGRRRGALDRPTVDDRPGYTPPTKHDTFGRPTP